MKDVKVKRSDDTYFSGNATNDTFYPGCQYQQPNMTQMPETTPNYNFGMPGSPSVPNVPSMPLVPNIPTHPGYPPMTNVPSMPGYPKEPSLPSVPSTPMTPSFQQGPPPVMAIDYIPGWLASNIGKAVRAEFMIGTSSFMDKSGILVDVGVNYFVLQDVGSRTLIMCDLYSVRFVTVLM